MSDRHWCKGYGTNGCFKSWNHRVPKFPGKFPGKPENSGKFPVSREAQNPGKLTPLLTGKCLTGKNLMAIVEESISPIWDFPNLIWKISNLNLEIGHLQITDERPQ